MHSHSGKRQMTLVLAFDCAVNGLGVAVADGERCLAVLREEGRDQAARLLPAIATALQEAHIDRRALQLIAVTIGPGSFTGVRVGLATARGLAVALGVPLAGLTTTAVLLAQAQRFDRLAVAAIDSKLGDWFCAIDEGERTPFLTPAAALAARLAGRPSVIIGPDAAALASSIPEAVAEAGPIDATVLARLAQTEGVEAWRVHNRREGLPRPLYLRGVNVTTPDGGRRTVE